MSPEHTPSQAPPKSSLLQASARSPLLHSSALDFVTGALPDTPLVQLEYVLKLLDHDVERTTNFFLAGVTLESLLDTMNCNLINEDEERSLLVSDMNNVEQMTNVALEFYQDSFNPKSRCYRE